MAIRGCPSIQPSSNIATVHNWFIHVRASHECSHSPDALLRWLEEELAQAGETTEADRRLLEGSLIRVQERWGACLPMHEVCERVWCTHARGLGREPRLLMHEVCGGGRLLMHEVGGWIHA